MLNRRQLLAGVMTPLARLAAAVKPVPITGVDIYPIRLPAARDEIAAGVNYQFSVVEVKTAAGVTGYSFAAPGANELPAVRQVLMGQNVFEVDELLKAGLIRWGGVEHAVWDAIGRIANQPVYKLLGGGADRVKAYLTCVWPGKADQSQVSYREQADMAARIHKAGFKGMKIRAWRPNPLDDAFACAEIRAATSPDFAIMFDRTAHLPVPMSGQRIWDYETGLKVARALEKAGALWLEEPFAREDYESPARLARETDILITGGEGYVGTEPFLECLKHRTYDILQPEGRGSGGILICRKVAMMAEGFHVPVILHGTMALMLAGWLQATFAIGCEWQEVALITPPLLPEQQWAPGLKVLKTPYMFKIEDGYILAPEHPGIGLDVNPDALREYRVSA